MQAHRARSAMAGLLAAATSVAMLFAIARRSPWYDEYYTLYVTRPGLPLREAWPMWLADNHPPLFYALAWASNTLGVAAEPRRLLNLAIALAVALALAALAARRPRLRTTLFAYATGLAASAPLIDRVAELRGNFLALAAGAIAVAALVALVQPGRLSRRGALALGATLALAWSVHLAATVIVGALALAFALRLWLAGDRTAALRFLAICALAGVPFVASMGLQASTIAANTRSFWIPGGLSAARWVIEGQLLAALSANPALTLAGSAGLVRLALQDMRARRLSTDSATVAAFAGGLALALALLVAIHLMRPFVVDRYLVTLHPIVAMILALGTARLARDMMRGRLLLDLCLVAAALLALAHNVPRTLARPGWDGTAARIARIVARCPQTQVIADLRWNADVMALPPVENRAVVPWAYAQVAARHHFALSHSARRKGPCPTIYWAEHVAARRASPAQVAAAIGVRSGRMERIGDGWIFIAQP